MHHDAPPRRRDNRRCSSDALSRCSLYDIAEIWSVLELYQYICMKWPNGICFVSEPGCPSDVWNVVFPPLLPHLSESEAGTPLKWRLTRGWEFELCVCIPRVGKASGSASQLARQVRHPGDGSDIGFVRPWLGSSRSRSWSISPGQSWTALRVSRQGVEGKGRRGDSAVRQTLANVSYHQKLLLQRHKNQV